MKRLIHLARQSPFSFILGIIFGSLLWGYFLWCLWGGRYGG